MPVVHTVSNTRYKILCYVHQAPEHQPFSEHVEKFTGRQKKTFLQRCRALRTEGVRFTTWDTKHQRCCIMITLDQSVKAQLAAQKLVLTSKAKQELRKEQRLLMYRYRASTLTPQNRQRLAELKFLLET